MELAQRELVPEGTTTAKALDYSLKRWVALTLYLQDGTVPIDNNQIENLIRPWALGRSNWLFSRSPRSGKRAVAIMRLIPSACMNGHDLSAYLKDRLTRLVGQDKSAVFFSIPPTQQKADHHAALLVVALSDGQQLFQGVMGMWIKDSINRIVSLSS